MRTKEKIRWAHTLAEFVSLDLEDVDPQDDSEDVVDPEDVKRLESEFVKLDPEGVVDLEDVDSEDSEDVKRFRRLESDFVPQAWWDYQPTDSSGKPWGRQWRINQRMLRKAWQQQFRIGQFELMRLLLSVFDPNHLTDVMLPNPSRANLPVFATPSELPAEMYPYQQAVLFLFEENWRVGRCEREECHTFFMRTHSRGKFCGEKCAGEKRAEDQERDRIEHRDERNKKRRSKYAQEKRLRGSVAKLKRTKRTK